MDRYILDVYLPAHRQDKPMPAIVSPVKPGKRKYVRVQPDAVWSLLQDSRSSGCSLAAIVRVRSADSHVGCCETRAELWKTKHQYLYQQRRALLFHGTRHLNMIADPSTHIKRETMAAMCWSWEAGGAAHGDVQIMPATSNLAVGAGAPHPHWGIGGTAPPRMSQRLPSVASVVAHDPGLGQ